MLLYRHHTGDDLIVLNPETGRWRLATGDEDEPASGLGLAYRDDCPVRGSYEEDEQGRFFAYWTEDKKFVFRTPDDVFEAFQKKPDGRIVELIPETRFEIAPAKFIDGRLRRGLNTVRILSTDNVLCEFVYDPSPFVRLYEADFTAASIVRDLSDWDFFVAVQRCFEELGDRVRNGRVELSFGTNDNVEVEGRQVRRDQLIFTESGKPAPRAGRWAAADDLHAHVHVSEGETLPQNKGRDTRWVWIEQ